MTPSQYIGKALHDAKMDDMVLVELHQAINIDDEDDVVIRESEPRPISIAWIAVGFAFALGIVTGGLLF